MLDPNTSTNVIHIASISHLSYLASHIHVELLLGRGHARAAAGCGPAADGPRATSCAEDWRRQAHRARFALAAWVIRWRDMLQLRSADTAPARR
jgi:hypothetical protein